MNTLCYLIGAPGAGKTTALRIALQDLIPQEQRTPFAHQVYPGGAVLGQERGTFSGTDALGMDVQPKVLAWLEGDGRQHRIVLGEGDRLGNESFFKSVKGLGWTLNVWLLDVPRLIAAERRAARVADADMKPQNETWIRGRATKVDRLLPYVTLVYDGMRSPTDVGESLRGHTAIRMLRGESQNAR